MSTPAPEAGAGLVEVLAAHAIQQYDPACSCGWNWDSSKVILPNQVDFDLARCRLSDVVRPEQFATHLARVVQAHVDAAVAEALEGAAVAVEARMGRDADYDDGMEDAARIVREQIPAEREK